MRTFQVGARKKKRPQSAAKAEENGRRTFPPKIVTLFRCGVNLCGQCFVTAPHHTILVPRGSIDPAPRHPR